MNTERLQSIRIEPAQRRRRQGATWFIFAVVFLAAATAAFFAWPKEGDEKRIFKGKTKVASADTVGSEISPASPSTESIPAPVIAETAADDSKPKIQNSAASPVLTISGYIVNRERIEISPRMMGQVKWIGVRKGDLVKKDQVLVQLDDAEQQARLLEIDAQIAGAKVAVERAKIAYDRVRKLRESKNETAEREDETRLAVAAAEATLQQMEGIRALAQVQLDWTVIRSPIDGVVLEKLAVAGALVTPQSFGGARGPSTALVSLADPQDLQVEIDVNETDLPKIALNQRCRITPEAFPDQHYEGHVAEIAPEASRQKGTLQIKVQIAKPDRYLTPELSAKVEFFRAPPRE